MLLEMLLILDGLVNQAHQTPVLLIDDALLVEEIDGEGDGHAQT